MARQTTPQHPAAQRALIALASVGAALGAGAATAHADAAATVADVPWRAASLGHVDPQAGLTVLTGSVGYVTGPVAGLKPNPLAGTGADPLANGVATRVADFQPLETTMVTEPVAEPDSFEAVPGVGPLLGVLGA
ncbi:hypothetical protein [Streptomyces sp. MMG1121]|uniref:hypothetical protein n=1 Tax=Streptomyces sp. MMG1121 TaxID=1415544 RepID=UPI0006AFD2AC|nr:hypothetical protein [Streptomyces sp. MMG1121]KOV63629.1 hypothetical protein ADK64_18795 [Streptomyces sp. MMG1121]